MTINATAHVTDPLGLTATDTLAIPEGGPAGITAVRRSLLGTRVIWGPVIDQGGVLGPTVQADAQARVLSVFFKLQWDARITGGRFYKAPLLAGDVEFKLWEVTGTGIGVTGTQIAAVTLPGLAADQGGEHAFTFPTPIAGAAGKTYAVTYLAQSGDYVASDWVWHAMDWVNPPFEVPMFKESSQGRWDGSAWINATDIGHVFPTQHFARNYYIDVDVEWDVTTPRYRAGRSYYDQWSNGQSPNQFPVGVFFFDPPYTADYASIGINTLIGGTPADQGYFDALKASPMDWWPTLDRQSMVIETLTPIAEDPEIAAIVRGYFLGDEPDMIASPDWGGWRSPQYFRDLKAAIRRIDSSRPTMMNLGKWPPLNMSFAWQPGGATPQQVNQYWRGYADVVDVLSCDFYNMTSDQAGGIYGIWTYPRITRRMMDLNDGKTPVWGYVETTAQIPDEPAPEQVYRATWAHLIEGAKGIVFFDHRFGDSDVNQDFAALLHDPPMRAMVQAIAAQLQTLGAALFAPDAALVSSVDSSNRTAGPYGGTRGVPMHYTTRVAGGTTYLFAMSIRPGSTTATFTVPAAAGKTLTVIGESRTVTANGSGVFTDDFADGDYTVHLYSWAG
jgi:hypothetical protein